MAMTPISRRTLLRGSLWAACSAAASPLVTPFVHAALPGENRLVVIVLRGGMDGLGVVQPYGDPAFAGLRPGLAGATRRQPKDLDGFFALGGGLEPLHGLWQQGELAFAHAVATPYRDKRSHFDGQDILESGAAGKGGGHPGDGWLNRALALVPGARAETAMAIGSEHMLILEGPAEAQSWSPVNELRLSDDERQLVSRLYQADPLFAAALKGAEALGGMGMEAAPRENAGALASFAATVLNGESRIAAFSIGGWDTHRQQARTLPRASRHLVEAVTTLKSGLGGNWGRTLVLAMTEFGRTARENGSGGTDHGTGGVLLMAGGLLRKAEVHGRWPGLGEGALYMDRDLMPTADLRLYPAWALSALFGLDRAQVERAVFPGIEMGAEPGFLA